MNQVAIPLSPAVDCLLATLAHVAELSLPHPAGYRLQHGGIAVQAGKTEDLKEGVEHFVDRRRLAVGRGAQLHEIKHPFGRDRSKQTRRRDDDE